MKSLVLNSGFNNIKDKYQAFSHLVLKDPKSIREFLSRESYPKDLILDLRNIRDFRPFLKFVEEFQGNLFVFAFDPVSAVFLSRFHFYKKRVNLKKDETIFKLIPMSETIREKVASIKMHIDRT